MVWSRRRKHLLARLALVLLVAVALVPTLSRMVGFAQGAGSPWLLVCTAADAAVGGPAGDAAPGAADHCPLCSLQAQGWLGHTQWSLWDRVPAPRDLLPALFLWVAYPLFAWAAKQPRGPPARA